MNLPQAHFVRGPRRARQYRRRGFNATGETAGKSGLDEAGAMSVAECAGLIVAGTQARRRNIVMSGKGKLSRWLKLMSPGLLDRLALKALSKDAHR